MENVNRQHYSILVIIWMESMLPTRTFDFVTSTKFVNAYCDGSRSLVNLSSTSNAGVVKIDDVTTLLHLPATAYMLCMVASLTSGQQLQRQPAALQMNFNQ